MEAGNRLRLGVKLASGDLLDLHVLYNTLQTEPQWSALDSGW